MLQPTADLQTILNNSKGIYVEDAHYIAGHNFMPLGRKIRKLKKWDTFEFNGKKCEVTSKSRINYRKETMKALTGASLYLQTCSMQDDIGYLVKANCY